jgi:hypothetical protein
MHFEGTITLGELVQIIAWLLAAMSVYMRLAERLIRIETKVDVLWGKLILGVLPEKLP